MVISVSASSAGVQGGVTVEAEQAFSQLKYELSWPTALGRKRQPKERGRQAIWTKGVGGLLTLDTEGSLTAKLGR